MSSAWPGGRAGGGMLSELRTQRHPLSVCIAQGTHASTGLRAGAPASPGVRCQRLGSATSTPWLLQAPPWQPAAEQPARPKRPADQISTLAELELGKLARGFCAQVMQHGWERVVQQTRGRSNFSPDVRRLPHKAARLLEHLRRWGASVPTSTPPWTPPQQHKSAI